MCRVSTRNTEGGLGNGAHGRRAIAQPVAHGSRGRGVRPQEGVVRVHRIRVDRGVMMRILIQTILARIARIVRHRRRRRRSEWPDVGADADTAHLALSLQVPVEDRARDGRRCAHAGWARPGAGSAQAKWVEGGRGGDTCGRVLSMTERPSGC